MKIRLFSQSLVAAALWILFLHPAAPLQALEGDTQGEFKVKLDQGLEAVKQNDFKEATRFFDEAFQISPENSLAYFNLGLAHDKAGHELPAIAWFQAYLRAEPQNENREAIEKYILALEDAVGARASAIFSQAEEMATAIPDDMETFHQRSSAFMDIFAVYAGSGAIDKAVAYAEKNKIHLENPVKSKALYYYGLQLAADNELDVAFNIATQLPEGLRQELIQNIIKGYLHSKNPDIEKAYQTFSHLPKPDECVYTESLAKGLARKGKWREAEHLAANQKYESIRIDSFIALAKVAVEENRLDKARECLAQAEKLLPLVVAYKMFDVADLYAEIGDVQGAERVLGIKGSVIAPDNVRRAAQTYARMGMPKKAKKYFKMIPSGLDRSFAARTITSISIKKNDLKTAKFFLPYLYAETAYLENAEFAWAMIKSGKEADVKQIIKKIPEKKEKDQEDLFYLKLLELAVADGDINRAQEYFPRIRSPWSYHGVISLAAAELKDKRYDAAVKLLSEHPETASTAWDTFLDILDKAGRKEDIMMLLSVNGLRIQDPKTLSVIAQYYEKYGQKDQAERMKTLALNMESALFAREMERWKGSDQEAAFQEIRKQPSGKIPGALANIAQAYLNGLKKIQAMK